MFIFLTIWIFKIPQYRCHLNNVWNATLLERVSFHCCILARIQLYVLISVKVPNWSTSRMWRERSHPQYSHRLPQISPSAAQLPRLSQTKVLRRCDGFPVNCRVPAFLNSLFITLRDRKHLHFSNSAIHVLILAWIGLKWRKDEVCSVCWGRCDQSLEWIKARSSLHSKRSVITPLWIHSGFYIPAHGETAPCSPFKRYQGLLLREKKHVAHCCCSAEHQKSSPPANIVTAMHHSQSGS